MLLQAHRGVSTEFPENTLIAFKAAAMQGYDVIELDPAFTCDGKCVVLHDKTVNRTCRRPSGQTLPFDINIRDISYADTLRLDAGIYKDIKFRGERIPLLSQALELARSYGVTVKIDNKAQSFSDEEKEIMFSDIQKSGASVAFTCKTEEYIKTVVNRFPNAPIHYDGYVDADTVKRIISLLKNNPLTVWLALPTKNTEWVKVPRASKELCREIKELCTLGIWIIATEQEYSEAIALGADVIETTGRIKPSNTVAGNFDMHTHTVHSHDATSDPEELCLKEMELNMAGVAFTDHFDNHLSRTVDHKERICASVSAAQELALRFSDRLKLIRGIEIGEEIWDREMAQKARQYADFDVILGSVHAVRYKDLQIPYSLFDFTDKDDAYIHGFLTQYFSDLLEMVSTTDLDILTHLSCPLRYLIGKFGKKIDLSRYDAQIDAILDKAVQRHLALEINTSGINTPFARYFPDLEYVQRFISKGGYIITLGSDAHSAQNGGKGINRLAKELKDMGIHTAYYYLDRIPIPYELVVQK